MYFPTFLDDGREGNWLASPSYLCSQHVDPACPVGQFGCLSITTVMLS